VARALGGEVGDRRAEVHVAGEREPAVGRGALEPGHGLRDRLGRQREVGVEVLHAQDRPLGTQLVGGVGGAVDAEADDLGSAA